MSSEVDSVSGIASKGLNAQSVLRVFEVGHSREAGIGAAWAWTVLVCLIIWIVYTFMMVGRSLRSSLIRAMGRAQPPPPHTHVSDIRVPVSLRDPVRERDEPTARRLQPMAATGSSTPSATTQGCATQPATTDKDLVYDKGNRQGVYGSTLGEGLPAFCDIVPVLAGHELRNSLET